MILSSGSGGEEEYHRRRARRFLRNGKARQHCAHGGPGRPHDVHTEIEKPMMVDAATCMLSGLVGRSTAGAYIESATGIGDGARTGLAAVTTGVLFLASLFFIPLVEPLQSLRYAYAPALIVVGLLMLASARHIAYDDMTELVPAFATIALLVFTYNIANGLAAGLALHPIVKVAAGRAREVRPGAWVLAAMSFLYYAFGIPH
ncbi:MAG TPA: NCS2 family permease [Vicinamibacteria bacterium]|nr:NCS2 family permease [Vicinamibacteria bacterium]